MKDALIIAAVYVGYVAAIYALVLGGALLMCMLSGGG